jgi:PAS domain S-box-containing protein
MTLRRKLWKGPYLALALTSITVAVCLAILLLKVFWGQMALKESLLNDFGQGLEKHAAALSYFYTERKNDLNNLPTKREISIYFENKALGMSLEYGLRASLIAIRESFNQLLRERLLGRDPIYTRFLFADPEGRCLIDTEEASQSSPSHNYCQEFLTPDKTEPLILVRKLDNQAQIIVSCPYSFKGQYSGQIIAWISMETMQKHLIGPKSRYGNKIVRIFSSHGDFYLPADNEVSINLPEVTTLMATKYCQYCVTDSQGASVEMISALVPIHDTPLSLVGIIPNRELMGSLSPWHFLVALGALSLLSMGGGGVVWWGHTRNLILQTRLEEAAIREQEIAEKNRQLEEEIVERKRAEASARQAEEKYRAIFDNAVEGIFQSTPEGAFLSVNPAMAKMHGFASPQEMLQEVTDIKQQLYVDPQRRDDRQKLMARQGFVQGFECQVYKKGDGKLWVSQSARTVTDDRGNVVYYEGFVQDVTERKEAEELSRNLITAAPIGIYIIQDGKFQVVNQWFNEITSLSKDELARISPAQLAHPDDRQEVERKAALMLEGQSSTPYEYRVLGKGGEVKWIMETVTPATYRGKAAILGFSMDVTAHKELEKQLLQAQKMEAVGRLAGGVAHDFNNMLGAIIGYNEMMLKRLDSSDQIHHYGEEIRKAADRAAMLTRQLLAFSRKQVLQPQRLNLNTIINDLERMLRRLIGEDIDLVLNLDPTVATVKADSGQMEQVLLNLAVNARDAMPKGGKLIISTTNVHMRVAVVQEQADFAPGPYVLLTVSDDGLGMSAETLDHIFEPFFTTKALGSGTGLGLSTVYGIIRQSGGFIEVNSEPGLGTSFKIYLPTVGESLELSKGPGIEAEPLRGWETILLVEDEDILRQLIKNALVMNGYNVLEARGSREALAICQGSREPIHLMLTDVVMPQMSGRELALRLEQLRPEIKVLYMSGYAEDVLSRQGVLESSIPFLQKPFRQYELTAKIREVLDAPPQE